MGKNMLKFSKSVVDEFRHRNKALRWGQAFHQYMKLEKITNDADKRFCDRLYNAEESVAKAMVQSRIDRTQ